MGKGDGRGAGVGIVVSVAGHVGYGGCGMHIGLIDVLLWEYLGVVL
jgi:hypothetical protein